MKHFTACVSDQQSDGAAVAFADGTIRRSIALTEGMNKKLPLTSSCQEFEESLVPFRSAVDKVIDMFVRRLSSEIGPSLKQPLLTGRSNGKEIAWDNLESVVDGSEYLDHFHSYQKLTDAEDKTIEYHVDQGLLLAFSPGLMMELGEVTSVSDGFYVRDVKGKEYELMFSEEDDLVFMLGDGVNQW